MLFRTIAATAILALSIPAAQAAIVRPASVEVTFGDLNLSHTADAKILASRLQAAAKAVCLTANPDIKAGEMQQCIDAAISLALARIEGRLDSSVRASLATVAAETENP